MNTDTEVAFLGLLVAFFIGTLVISAFSEGRIPRWLIFVHFGNFMVPTAALIVAIAFGNDATGVLAFGLWAVSVVCSVGFLVLLWRDLWDRSRPKS